MVCIKIDAINVRFLPYLSDKMPQTSPPIATPAKKTISDKLVRVFRSHTRLNSEIRVCPAMIILDRNLCKVVDKAIIKFD